MLSKIFDLILKLFSPFYEPFLQMYIEKAKKLFRNKVFYSDNEVYQRALDYNFSPKLSLTTEPIFLVEAGNLKDDYNKSFKEIKVKRERIEFKFELPYKEVINFIEAPDTTITITNPNNIKRFQLSEALNKLTQPAYEEFMGKKPNTYNDSHPRIASLYKTDDKYSCTIEEADYFQQIRTNLSLDFKINMENEQETTLRNIEQNNRVTESQDLPEFSESCLANTIGVSAIWMMKRSIWSKDVFLRPRKNNVGVFAGKLGIPSGSVEMPKGSRFRTKNLVEYLTLDIAREFIEETGLFGEKVYVGKNRENTITFSDIKKNFELPNDFPTPITLPESVEMTIIPLAFVRELRRGGKPQMFFLITTKEIPDVIIRKGFVQSKGNEEFEKTLLTSATLSSETMSNYVYAQKYIHP